MTEPQQIWLLDDLGSDYQHLCDELQAGGVILTRYRSAREMLAAARSIHARLPRLLVAGSAQFEALLQSQTIAAPRVALLRQVPVVVIAEPGSSDRMQGFKNGTLEVLQKPCSESTLRETIYRYLGRESTEEKSGEAPKLRFNLAFLQVGCGNAPQVTLTPREFQVLSLLYRADSHRVERSELHAQVWSEVKVCNKVLDVHISKLRKKLVPIGVGISFQRPASYQLEFQTPQQ